MATFHRWLVMMALPAVLAVPAAAADVYDVDPVHSTVMFKVKHLGISLTFGRFTDFAGEIVHDPDEPVKNSVEFEIVTDSIDTANFDRDQHLRAGDFFNVEKYPTAEFKSTSVKKVKDASYEVAGHFTLLDVTKPITVAVDYLGTGKGREGEQRAGCLATFTIKRSDFGMATYLGLIGDEVEITVAVEAIRREDVKETS